MTIAVGVTAVLLIAALSATRPAAGADLFGYAWLVTGGLALVARRRAPVAVLILTGVCAVGHQASGIEVPAVAFLFAVYAAVRAGHRTVTVVAAVAMLVSLPLAALALPPGLPVGEALARARDALEVAWLIAAGAAGEALRQAERRAEEAERTREEAARRRADEERLHIARELHDSLTHQISIIKVQAEVAVHLASRRGEPVPEALAAIREASREATRELRATLETLRADGTATAPGLDELPDLVRRARMAGLEATLTIDGQRPDVPVAVGRTAYRIVQESLTNIARHASTASASVRLDYRPGILAIRVDDDGDGPPGRAAAPGVGLLGMRERVVALGGLLRAEARDEGGFTVHAELPVSTA
ncbi:MULTISPECIES: histidine kinase [unclassified Micromonospora]|uniref:sensor histidine kinase n=1 Tax=unclassified Micromonospora TaxID=2617518 RepID=UPI0022B651F9|nr:MULTISPECIES: histidine kinase [unclassified Micromonospora]MCZ7422789.1 histidine kinase [Verrucosispora sp. WMMA2121]WBB90527.1 histidine kinase [Verrucosispora sp. WMMC514]